MSSSALKKQTLPESISEELLLIQEMNGGLLNPLHIVDYARSTNTLLHNKFEWDDSKAAEEHRLWQARKIISLELVIVNKKASKRQKLSAKITTEKDSQKTVRAFVSLMDDRNKDGGYRGIHNVLSNEGLRAKLLDEAKKDMLIFRRKYYLLRELNNVFCEMDKIK